MTDLRLLATKIVLFITAITLVLVGVALEQHETLAGIQDFSMDELEEFISTYGDFPVPWGS